MILSTSRALPSPALLLVAAAGMGAADGYYVGLTGGGSMRQVTKVSVVTGYVVDLTFDDDSTRRVDLTPYLWGEIFAVVLADYAVFCSVRVDPDIGTIVWPNGADIDPDVLHGDALPASGPLASAG
jgi:hypothetical protein